LVSRKGTSTLACDAKAVITNVASFPEGGTFKSGDIGFGPQPFTNMVGSSPPIVIDYADFRFAQK
jgi:hypothetical protein